MRSDFRDGSNIGPPTASMRGVRFPAGSPAAIAHTAEGWIPIGAASLPVPPTELYESTLGLAATALAIVPCIVLLRAEREARGPADTGATPEALAEAVAA